MSHTDLALVRDLRYSDDIEALRIKGETKPAVDEGWQPEIDTATFLRALLGDLATHDAEGSEP